MTVAFQDCELKTLGGGTVGKEPHNMKEGIHLYKKYIENIIYT